MDEFRSPFGLCGDVLHLTSFFVLLLRMWIHKNSAGISAKSQVLIVLVLTTRSLDLYTNPSSWRNFDFKLTFLFLSFITVISIYTRFRNTYERENDSFFTEFLTALSVLLAMLYSYDPTSFVDFGWTFSQYLEAMAMYPQFYMIYKKRNVSRIIFSYLTVRGMYRILCLMHWGYMFYSGVGSDAMLWWSGGAHVAPYVLFWISCTFKIVKITKETSWYNRNLPKTHGVFTVEVGKRDETPLVKN